MKIKDLPLHERPREKLLLKGVENVKDHELLAILLRTGTEGKNVVEVAKNIITKHSMKMLLELSLPQLVELKGIGKDKACTLLAAFELTKRALDVHDTNLPLIETPQAVVDQLSDLRLLKKEHFIVLYLNARNRLVLRETISIGTINISIVHPREVFEPAIRMCAAQIILAHNHPSGDTEPSDADVTITKRLIEAGKLIGIDVVDHIIITKNGFGSLREEGIFEE